MGAAESVVDVGRRDKALRDHLPQGVRYVGLDLCPPADVIADAEQPLPFSDREFSCVVLADVLEHLDDPHAALGEAMRVGKSAVVLLPNMLALEHRLSFLRGKLDTSKYDFGPDNPRDRHRWLMNHDQARDFTRAVAAEAGCGWHVRSQRPRSRRSP